MEMTLTRAKFDDLTRDLVERTKTPVRQALSDAGLSLSEIDEVIPLLVVQLVSQPLLKLLRLKLVKNQTNQLTLTK